MDDDHGLVNKVLAAMVRGDDGVAAFVAALGSEATSVLHCGFHSLLLVCCHATEQARVATTRSLARSRTCHGQSP